MKKARQALCVSKSNGSLTLGTRLQPDVFHSSVHLQEAAEEEGEEGERGKKIKQTKGGGVK